MTSKQIKIARIILLVFQVIFVFGSIYVICLGPWFVVLIGLMCLAFNSWAIVNNVKWLRGCYG